MSPDAARPRALGLQIAERLSAFQDAGVDEIQLIVDPITTSSVEWLGGVLDGLAH